MAFPLLSDRAGQSMGLSLASSSARKPDHRHLLPPRQGLDRRLSPQCQTSACVGLPVDHCDRQTAAGISGGGPGIVLPAAAAHVLGDAGVERTIGATEAGRRTIGCQATSAWACGLSSASS